jgi:HSP20 family molecular chaperone IbpA
MARKESRELAKAEPTNLPPPSLNQETRFKEAMGRTFPLTGLPNVKSPGAKKPGPPKDVFEQKNNGAIKVELPSHKKEDIDAALTIDTSSTARENDDEEGVNDYILCLGYMPDKVTKPIEDRRDDEEEVNDYILCLGYRPDKM